ncbi:transcription termination factor NusA [bacterium]|nr:transcription termination factor NusA [bacterium]
MNELSKVLEQVGKDKGIDRGIIVSAVEEALMTVAKRKYGLTRDIEARFNEESGEVDLYQFMDVVESVEDKEKQISLSEAHTYDPEVGVGDSIGIKLDTTVLSRIAAQTAKQVIVQKLRDAEREIIFNEFQHRKGEVITGLIRRVDRGAVVIDLGRTEAYMPTREQIPGELYNPGDRIQCYLNDVQVTPKGPRIILSRACPEYLITLFNSEVPEVREGLVVIKGAARDPGVRAKIAVFSRDPDIDPVGACVGVRGSRVQNIVQELKGERIDIVPWDEDITRFVCNALAPAEIQKVIIDDEDKSIETVVDDAHLSIAIGKRGQNVRLASQLTGWKLDITSESEMARKAANAKLQMMLLPDVTDTLAVSLYQNGFNTVRDVANIEPSFIADVPGFDAAKAEKLVAAAQKFIESGEYEKFIADQKAKAEEESQAAASGTKSESSEPASAMDSIEAKLRAEVAAMEKSKES